jgi:hypothetical protein
MKLCALLLLPGAIFAATNPDLASNPVEIARKAVRNFQSDQMTTLKYTYLETDDHETKGITVSQFSTIEGTPYGRVISKNGVTLSGNAEKHEDDKLEKTKIARASEVKAQRDKRLRAYKDQTRFLEEAPEAFDFKVLPVEVVDGRAAYVVEGTPKPGFEPQSGHAKMFTKVQIKAWVDKQDLRIVKVEAEVMDPVSIGWILAQVGTGTHMELEQMLLDDGTWVVKKLSIEGRAKILHMHNKQLDESWTDSQYVRVPQDHKPGPVAEPTQSR